MDGFMQQSTSPVFRGDEYDMGEIDDDSSFDDPR